ncbi:MAG TPA: RDD family protein [Longimicrobiales bacterium]|nr:RDD family protein [Longimicrobiales bacterium]
MPIRVAPQRDPRSIVTPDAFEVAPALLGLPLASPRRRLAALLVDLGVIGVITLLTKNFALVLGLVAAALFIREGFKRTPVQGSAFGRAMRMSVGCLGTWIGIITIVAGMAMAGKLGSDGGEPSGSPSPSDVPEARLSGVAGLVTLIEGVGDARRIERAETRSEALAAATDLARRGFAAGMSKEQVQHVLVDVLPDDAVWSPETEIIVDQAMAAALGDTALVRETAKLAAADSAEADTTVTGVLDPVLADSLRSMQVRVASLTVSTESQQRELQSLREELRQEQEGGALLASFRGILDELGFGFGWASLYLTIMLSWWKGQTIGKRLLKIRVLRLDGEPITWWTAFERAGGYAAGLATGLLGFAQVYWDSNRQAIHDRIVGTVVVMDGAEKVVDWEKAL